MLITENEKVLTNTELISYLLQNEKGEDEMKGVIRPRGACPICEQSFTEIKKLGFICPEHKTTPSRYVIDFRWKKERIRVYSDKQGNILSSYDQARNLLIFINKEINDHTFDPSVYLKQEQKKYYTCNLLDQFAEHKSSSIAPGYKAHYRIFVNRHKQFFGAADVRELRKIDIINYKTHLEKNYNISSKTIKNVLSNLKTFLNYVKNDLEIIQCVPVFPEVIAEAPQTVWLTQEVQAKVYKNIPDVDKPIFAFLILSGCRPSEARALRCKNVNLDMGTITISATFSASVYREQRKGMKARSVVIPIHPEILDFIKNRVENNLPDSYVFVNSRTDKYYPESTLKRIWQRVKRVTGLPEHIRMYDATRHSFASNLINQGVPLYSVSKLLGHSSIKMTEKYTHSDINQRQVDVSKLSLDGEKKIVEFKDRKTKVNKI